MSAREEILTRIRGGLAGARADGVGPQPPPPPFPRFGDGLGTCAARVARFRQVLASVGAESAVVREPKDAGSLLSAWLAERAAGTLAVSDGELARAVAEAARDAGGVRLVEPSASRETLLNTDAGITGARLAIAETGTLALTSADERSRLASLVPPVAVAVIPVEDLVATIEDALRALEPTDPATDSRAITFVTGPSRTADIEMTLVVGVHGPKELLVLLLDPHAPALELPSDPESGPA